jgi:hypothetical protein
MIQTAFMLHESHSAKIAAFEQQALQCVAVKERVFIFEVNLYGDQSTSLDVMILDAVIKSNRSVHCPTTFNPSHSLADISSSTDWTSGSTPTTW